MELEKKRSILEQQDRIENALVQRIKKSDDYLPKTVSPFRVHKGKHAYSARENAFRRWETARLVDLYYDAAKSWNSGAASASAGTSFQDELAQLAAIDDEVPAIGLDEMFQLRKERKGLSRLASNATDSVTAEFEKEYPTIESFGQVLDLEPFYSRLLASEVPEKPTAYKSYLKNLDSFASHGSRDLLLYLMSFYDRAYAVGKASKTSARDLIELHVSEQATENASPTYCVYCNKEFANISVFNAHLNGRKHKRAVKLATSGTPELANEDLSIRIMLNLLQDSIRSTIAHVERKSGMTLQDRKLEIETLEREKQREDEFNTDDDDDGDYENGHSAQSAVAQSSSVKPLKGPEGEPIPRWLFRLQGLGVIFKCEICGPNVKYSGRKAFEKHFSSAVHLEGLRKLGITPSPIFRGITSIKDAKELQQKLEAKSSNDTEKEVEDDEGNVLSESMYEELKKQGLL